MESQSKELCKICNQQSYGFHFGIQACRACSAFFRRSVSNCRKYKCYRNGNCSIGGRRMANCRACRFTKCLKVGMRMELVQNRNRSLSDSCDDSYNINLSKVKNFNTSLSIIEVSSRRVSTIEKMNYGLLDYNRQQRSLFIILYPELDPDLLHMVPYEECVRMENGCMNLILNTTTQYIPEFCTIDSNLMIAAFRNFAAHFSMFFQSFQTMTTFKDPSDWRFLLHYGQVLDCKQVDYFHKNDPDPPISVRQSLAVGNRCVDLIRKMRELKIREIEVASLMGIKLWNEVAILSPSHANFVEKQKIRIYKELYTDIEHKYRSPSSGPRFGNLLLLLNYIEPIVTQLLENAAMDRVFKIYKLNDGK